jgi:plastocyanin
MTKLLALICSILALGLVAAGCGSDDSGGGGGDNAKTEKQPAAGGGKKTGKTVAVAQKNIQFAPKSVNVPTGATVKWTNDDSTAHDVTKTGGPGPDFSSGQGNMQQGDTYEQTFKTPGTIKYVCTVHPGMEGTVTVK